MWHKPHALPFIYLVHCLIFQDVSNIIFNQRTTYNHLMSLPYAYIYLWRMLD